MKYKFLVLFILSVYHLHSQDASSYYLQGDYLYGTLLDHNRRISAISTSHPNGFILSCYKPTNGSENWHKSYNYPDVGYSLIYTDFRNGNIGENIGIAAFRNFYFGSRDSDNQFNFRVGFGFAYNSNPFDLETNLKNTALGSHINMVSYLMLNYKRINLIENLGFQSGLSILHFSNGAINTPNAGANVLSFNIGLNYQFKYSEKLAIPKTIEPEQLESENIKFNIIALGGINSSFKYGDGIYPFGVISTYVDKRLGEKSIIQLGFDIIASTIYKESIIFYNAQKNGNFNPDDFIRVGLILGHNLRMGDLAFTTQIGYYLHKNFTEENYIIYTRLGIEKYLTDNIYARLSVRSHFAVAEALEIGIGYRF